MNYQTHKNLLLLGGAGFIGSNLISPLLKNGYQVTVIDAFLEGSGASLKHLEPFLPFIRLIKQPVEMVSDFGSIINDTNFIIDAMGLTSHTQGLYDPHYDIQANLISHIHLIQQLRTFQGLVIYLGSRAQYGKSTNGLVVNEDSPTIPIDVQGVHKQAAESYFRIFSQNYGFSAISLRLTNCYGQNQPYKNKDNGLFANLVISILRDRYAEIYDGERKRQFLYVEDLSRCVLRVLSQKWTGFHVFNLAGTETRINDLANIIITNIGYGQIVQKPMPTNIQILDAGSLILSDKAIKKVFPDFSYTSLAESIGSTISYFQTMLYG